MYRFLDKGKRDAIVSYVTESFVLRYKGTSFLDVWQNSMYDDYDYARRERTRGETLGTVRNDHYDQAMASKPGGKEDRKIHPTRSSRCPRECIE